MAGILSSFSRHVTRSNARVAWYFATRFCVKSTNTIILVTLLLAAWIIASVEHEVTGGVSVRTLVRTALTGQPADHALVAVRGFLRLVPDAPAVWLPQQVPMNQSGWIAEMCMHPPISENGDRNTSSSSSSDGAAAALVKLAQTHVLPAPPANASCHAYASGKWNRAARLRLDSAVLNDAAGLQPPGPPPALGANAADAVPSYCSSSSALQQYQPADFVWDRTNDMGSLIGRRRGSACSVVSGVSPTIVLEVWTVYRQSMRNPAGGVSARPGPLTVVIQGSNLRDRRLWANLVSTLRGVLPVQDFESTFIASRTQSLVYGVSPAGDFATTHVLRQDLMRSDGSALMLLLVYVASETPTALADTLQWVNRTNVITVTRGSDGTDRKLQQLQFVTRSAAPTASTAGALLGSAVFSFDDVDRLVTRVCEADSACTAAARPTVEAQVFLSAVLAVLASR